jgi:hypothetical protein
VVETQLCQPAEETVGQLTLQTFDGSADLRDAWQADADGSGDLAVSADACANETPGADKWGFGNIICGIRDGRAEIRWTDTRSDSLGVVEGADGDVAALYEWWRANARPLGRAAETDETTDQVTPEKTPKPSLTNRKLVRVPGKPGNATCAASIDPIPDEWDRTWNITKVNFKNENGYERVVLHLDRTGKNRSAKPTKATVSRMSVNKLREAFPKVTRGAKGKVAIVLDIDGIDDAPTLFGYKPSGLDYVKQVWIFKSKGGYTMTLTAPQATCYQVRIPVWSSAATGTEKKAQIYIDLQPRR